MSDIFLEKVLKQTAVWWPVMTTGTPSGEQEYESPQEIKCRWTESADQMVGPNQEIVISNAKLLVDRDMTQGDLVRLGTLESVMYPHEPRANDGVWEIKVFGKIPNFKGKKFVRKVLV